jgi:hypothetical protein
MARRIRAQDDAPSRREPLFAATPNLFVEVDAAGTISSFRLPSPVDPA